MGNFDSTPCVSWGHSTPLTYSRRWPTATVTLCFLVCLLQLGRWLRGAGHSETVTGFLCLLSRLRARLLHPRPLCPFSFLWPFAWAAACSDPQCLLAGRSNLPGPCGPGMGGQARCLLTSTRGWGGCAWGLPSGFPSLPPSSDCRSGVPWVPVAWACPEEGRGQGTYGCGQGVASVAQGPGSLFTGALGSAPGRAGK